MPEDYWGDTTLLGKRASRHFLIRVNRDLDLTAALFVLAHEWGHALGWHLEADRGPQHDEVFALLKWRAEQAIFNWRDS